MIKLAKYLKPYTVLVILALVFVTVQVTATLELPRQMSKIVNFGIVQRGVEGLASNPAVRAQIIAATDAHQLSYIVSRGGVMLLTALIGMLAAISAGYFASRVSAGVARDVRRDIFTTVESYSLAEFDKLSNSSLVVRSTSDVVQVQQMTFMLLRMALMSPMTAIGAIGMALTTDYSLAWIIAVTIPCLLILIGFTIRYAMPLFREIQVNTDHLNLVAREGLTGVRVIRAFGREETQQERFFDANTSLTDNALKVNKTMVTLMPLMGLLMQGTTVAIIWFGAHYIDAGTLQIGDMMAFLQYAMQILMSVLMLSFIFIMYPRASVSAERIHEVLSTTSSVKDSPTPESIENVSPSVSFEDVSFSFENSEEAALCNITFNARAGTTTAIIGSTGSGKSTILNLITRLYDVTAGSIRVNGVDVRDISQHDLHDVIGYVPQQATLFSGTIAENLMLGNPDATDSDLTKALTTSQALTFVNDMPEGIDSVISQGGTNLSGGQKQRLAIARALVKRPRIYLFDDSFSALDLRTDAQLRKALAPEITDAVAIIVAQRVTSIIDADNIVVVDNGTIVGQGTHDELLASNEIYQEIAYSQMTEEELTHE